MSAPRRVFVHIDQQDTPLSTAKNLVPFPKSLVRKGLYIWGGFPPRSPSDQVDKRRCIVIVLCLSPSRIAQQHKVHRALDLLLRTDRPRKLCTGKTPLRPMYFHLFLQGTDK
jgi:hypothetical protein